MSNRYGYARVSTADQDPALQIEALRRAGVEVITEETGSGAADRPALRALLDRLSPGDELVVWKLDRLGRRAAEVILTIDDLRRRGVALRSVTEGIDTGTPAGRAFVGMLAVLAELERETTLERIRAGIAISVREGRHGRPRQWDPEQVRHAAALIAGGMSERQAARRCGLARSTLRDAMLRVAPAGR